MKKITFNLSHLLLLLITLSGFSLNSQIVSVTPTSDNNSCDGAAEILPQFQIPGQVWTFKKDDGTVLQYGNATSIHNLCSGAYILWYTDSNGVLINEGFIIGDDPCDFGVTMSVGPDNQTAVNCDGNAAVTAVISPTPCTFTWSGGITNSDSVQTNLCAGFYFCKVQQTGDCNQSITMGFSMGLNENFPDCSGLASTYTRINASSPTACDGSVQINATGGAPPYIYTYNRTDPANLPTSNPLFENLCSYNASLNLFNAYNITIQDNGGCTITHSVQVYDTMLSGHIHPVNATDTCNGSVLYVSVMGGTLPYTYLYSNGDTTQLTDSLCPGAYTLTVTDAVGATKVFNFNINTDTNLPFEAYVIPTTVSADGMCDGSAEVVISGGILPYSYYYSNGDTVEIATGLCGGVNTLVVKDASDLPQEIHISFIVPTPANTVSTANFSDSVLLDSIYNDAIINCDLNFNLIDSAEIVYYTVLPNDTINATWAVYSADSIIYIHSIYHLDTTFGVYLLTLEVYCPDKSLGNYLFASDQIYYNGESVANTIGIAEQFTTVSIYPNPFQDYLVVTLTNSLNSEIVITDISGKLVLNQRFTDSTIKIDMSRFSVGQYILTVKNDSAVITRKIVK